MFLSTHLVHPDASLDPKSMRNPPVRACHQGTPAAFRNEHDDNEANAAPPPAPRT